MRSKRVRLAGSLVATMLALAACGGGVDDDGSTDAGASGPVEGTLHVAASEFVYEPSELSAPADTETVVRVENVGSIEHDLVIDEANLRVAIPASARADGRFSLPAGTYTFYCSLRGHREAGMEGTLTVS